MTRFPSLCYLISKSTGVFQRLNELNICRSGKNNTSDHQTLEVAFAVSQMALATYLVFFLISHQLLVSLSEQYPNQRCPSFRCGHLNIGFPFSNRTHPECGLFVVDNCNEQEAPKIQLVKNESFFYVKEIYQDNTLRLHDHPFSESFDNNPSCESFRNMTLHHSPFISFNITSMQRLFKCPHAHYSIPKNYSLLCNFSTHSVIYHEDFFHFNLSNYQKQSHNSLPSPPAKCSVIHQQVTKTEKNIVFNNIYTSGFGFLLQVNVMRECYECHWRGGRCLDDSKGNFNCSKAEPDTKITEPGNAKGYKTIVAVAIATITATGIALLIILACRFRKRLSSVNSIVFRKKKCKDYRNIEAFLRNYGSLALKRYNYSDIKRMTNSFNHKLGQGGYGGVYKEMAGGRKNLDVGVDRTSEIYFPHWIYDRLEVAEELGLQGIENDDDNECARKMLTVSLWCIQTNPSSRPAMSRVVEMLEGSLDSLQFPPKPFLSSPRSEAADSLPSIVY
ncbi:hypothetical protein LWI29_037355 [Acer saccharum]|uniref:Wall-associated receptor kinase galacturonan-binding domain-containing protein n=1 Tax=Acer saccharum TaxID=4024 RepID=A0AA39RK64_ACESA|nr:hypothetical protein LWI29_037355 [Acer saccharum]